MADPPTQHAFPHDDALCERCGYPLKGMTGDAVCPECGADVAWSSPVRRKGPLFQWSMGIGEWIVTICQFLFFATWSFRRMRVDGSNRPARLFLFFLIVAASILSAASAWRDWLPIESDGLFHLTVFFILSALTYIEMLGVTAFSKRRGWRVPFRLAERVCCFAAVGWLPGVLVAGVGSLLLEAFDIDGAWFDQPLGLVRVRWLFYAALFVLSLLWFETLVWIGVRQVRYANAWPDPSAGAVGDAPEK